MFHLRGIFLYVFVSLINGVFYFLLFFVSFDEFSVVVFGLAFHLR